MIYTIREMSSISLSVLSAKGLMALLRDKKTTSKIRRTRA